jgi:hypothetical protein
MTCARCQGYLIPERFNDLFEKTGQMDSAGWRCVNCGDLFDGVILKHRRGDVAPYYSQRRWAGEGRRARAVEEAGEPVERSRNIVVA